MRREVANIAVLCAGRTRKTYAAELQAIQAGIAAPFPIEKKLALSNAGPLFGNQAPLPLNQFAGIPLDETLMFDLDRAGVEDEIQALLDFVLYIEYTANL